MKKITPKKFVSLAIPLLCMLALLTAVLLEQRGLRLSEWAETLPILDSADAVTALVSEGTEETLLVYNGNTEGEQTAVENVRAVLDAMRIPFSEVNLDAAPLGDLSTIRNLLYCSMDMQPLWVSINRINTWVTAGGHLAFLMTPNYDSLFMAFSPKLGIIECSGEVLFYSSIRFLDDHLPMYRAGDLYTDDRMNDTGLQLHLSSDCVVHVEDEKTGVPLLWERSVGTGRIVVCNMTLITEKASRGWITYALFALEDTVAYPIINAGMIFVDDFPAPQPEGTDESLREAYGYNIQGYFRNHWWPDMKELSWDEGVRYTGVLVETYNSTMFPPFEPDTEDNSLIRYYASELLHAGGEIGLHGYNHQPLCPHGTVYNGDNYTTWDSSENMSAAIAELQRYGKRIMPENGFTTYVPPSNYLSPMGKEAIISTLPNIRVFSGVYLEEENTTASLVQEFCEEEDGTISVPRITSGYSMDAYENQLMANELLLHGVFSHFIHPDDILDPERSKGYTWEQMMNNFTASIQKVNSVYPELRHMTASDAAGAVQRYSRLSVDRVWEENGDLTLKLDGFTGNAWLAVNTRSAAFTVEGGTAHAISDHFYWIEASQDVVRLHWEAAE